MKDVVDEVRPRQQDEAAHAASHAAQFERVQQTVRDLGGCTNGPRVDANFVHPELTIGAVVGGKPHDSAPAQGENPAPLLEPGPAGRRQALAPEQAPEVSDGYAPGVGSEDPEVHGAGGAGGQTRHHAESVSNPGASST